MEEDEAELLREESEARLRAKTAARFKIIERERAKDAALAASGFPKGTLLLHVMGQQCPHDDAVIAGNAAGIGLLLSAVLNVINQKGAPITTSFVDIFVRDGEGATLHVMLLDDESMMKTRLPYSDHEACGIADD